MARIDLFADLALGIGLNVPDAKIELFTSDVKSVSRLLVESGVLASAGLSPDIVEIVSQDPPTVPGQWKYPYLNGGAPLTSCTMGYIVRRLSDDRRFVSTAGHCDNAQSVDFAGSQSEDTFIGPIVSENNPFTSPPVGPLGYASDFQVHNSSDRDFDLTNPVQTDSSTLQRVNSSRTKGGLFGSYACKYGRATGFSCGQVININYAPELWFPTTYVLVSNPYYIGNFACYGDSGGPVFTTSGGPLAALGVLSVVEINCGTTGVSRSFAFTPVDEIQRLGFDILTYHRPQYYYQNVFWTATNCVEYSSQLDANGNITTQQSKACPTTPPGSGAVQSYTGYVVADTLREGIWRGNAGYLRAVPLTAEGRVNWNAAPAWSQVGGSTPPRAQDDYIIGNYYYQNVFWSETSCIEYRAPLDTNGNLITSQQTQGACHTTAPGTGTIQSYTAWVVNDQLREAMWRNNIGYMRTVPLNAAKTDAQWSSAPNWTQCCTGAAPQAQGVYILNHP